MCERQIVVFLCDFFLAFNVHMVFIFLDRVLVDWSRGGRDRALASLKAFLFLLVLEVKISFNSLFVV